MLILLLRRIALVGGVLSIIFGVVPNQVLAAGPYSPPSSSFYKQTFGFYGHTTPRWYNDWVDVDLHVDEFIKEKNLAKKYAPMVGVDPVLPVWWTYTETGKPGAKYDSYNYAYCGEAPSSVKYKLDRNCENPNWGGWQVGYGQQFTVIRESGLLARAYSAAYGDANNASKVQKVGQNVLNKSGINKIFPKITVGQIMSKVSTYNKVDGNYWAYTLMRDPNISMYLLSKEVSWDIGGGKARGLNYRQVMATWGESYYSSNWQNFSNVLWDIITLWRLTDAGQRP